MRNSDGGIVYSCEHGQMCPQCGEPVAGCSCGKKITKPSHSGVITVRRETKGRKGKGVTVIDGIPLDSAELKILVKQLKKLCGGGGTIKDGIVEIQGDHCAKLLDFMQRKGWKVKRTGG